MRGRKERKEIDDRGTAAGTGEVQPLRAPDGRVWSDSWAPTDCLIRFGCWHQLSRLASQSRLSDLLVDALGVGVAGQTTLTAQAAAAVLGHSGTPWDLAWLHGIRIHALDFDDTHEPSLCHTAAAIVPGLLALAIERDLSGLEVLHALDFGLRVVAFLAPIGSRLNEMGVHSRSCREFGRRGGLRLAAEPRRSRLPGGNRHGRRHGRGPGRRVRNPPSPSRPAARQR